MSPRRNFQGYNSVVCVVAPWRVQDRGVIELFDTVASQVSALSFVDIFNFCVFLTFTVCYTYQLYYVLVVLTDRKSVV